MANAIVAQFNLSDSAILAIAVATFLFVTASIILGGRAIRKRNICAVLVDVYKGLQTNVAYIKAGKQASGYTGELWGLHTRLKREKALLPTVALIELASQGIQEYNNRVTPPDEALARIADARDAIQLYLGREGQGA